MLAWTEQNFGNDQAGGSIVNNGTARLNTAGSIVHLTRRRRLHFFWTSNLGMSCFFHSVWARHRSSSSGRSEPQSIHDTARNGPVSSTIGGLFLRLSAGLNLAFYMAGPESRSLRFQQLSVLLRASTSVHDPILVRWFQHLTCSNPWWIPQVLPHTKTQPTHPAHTGAAKWPP